MAADEIVTTYSGPVRSLDLNDDAPRVQAVAIVGGAGGRFAPVGPPVSGANLVAAYTVTIPAGATAVLVQVFNQNVRVAFGGATPTASVGFQITPEDRIVVIPSSLAPITLIQEAATAGSYIQPVQ